MLRSVSEKDLSALAGLEERIFKDEAWTSQMLEEELQAPSRTYLGWEQGGELLAYAGYWFDGDDAELMTIGVDQGARRQGLARLLLKTLIDMARLQGASRMLLEVGVNNLPALSLYHAFGFYRIGLRRGYYQPQGIDAYSMAKNLGSGPYPVGGDRNGSGKEG